MIFAQQVSIWAGFAFLGAFLGALVVSATSHGALVQGLMSDRPGAPAKLPRTVFAFGSVGLALMFLVRILEFDGSSDAALAMSIKALGTLADIGAGDVELPTLSGALSGYYLWGKMKQ